MRDTSAQIAKEREGSPIMRNIEQWLDGKDVKLSKPDIAVMAASVAVSTALAWFVCVIALSL